MNHWILCLQDIWGFFRWVLPPFLFIISGYILSDNKDANDFLWANFAFIGGVLYIAAMLGWGLPK